MGGNIRVSEKRKLNRIYVDGRFYLCMAIVIFTFAVLILSLLHANSINPNSETIEYDELWSDESGAVVDFEELMKMGDYVEIHRRTNGDIINNKDLCFFSKNVYFTVYLDGEVIYDFHPEVPRIFGKSYGVYPHAIPIPVLYKDGNLVIRVENIYPGAAGYIKDVALADGNSFLIGQMQKSGPEFILCMIIFVFGMVLVVIGIVGRYFGERRYEIMSMGAFAVVAALWIATEGRLLPLLTNTPVTIHFVDYMMLGLLPIPTIYFAAYISENKDSIGAMIIGILSTINLTVSIFLTILGKRDYHQLLIISHVLLLATVLLVIFYFVKSAVLKRVRKSVMHILALTFVVPLVLGVAEVIRYRINPSNYMSTSSLKYILFLFISLVGVYEFVSISNMSKKSQYAEVMEELAYTDGLTGLLNREAYNQEIESVRGSNKQLTFVMLDLNYLKQVNDRLGHIMGDKYITGVANILMEAFTNGEKCYRIGGDEFFVITEYTEDNKKWTDAMDKIQSGVDKFNREYEPEIPLSIAIGAAVVKLGEEDIESVIRKADEKMYEVKKKMKESIVI